MYNSIVVSRRRFNYNHIYIYVYVLFVECFKQSVLILFFIVMLNKIEVKNFGLQGFQQVSKSPYFNWWSLKVPILIGGP